MPRPAAGYFNAAGNPIPGTHDPIKRYQNSEGLIRWAHGQGKKGIDLYARTALDIGHCVHAMAELDLKGAADRQIEQEAHTWLAAAEHLQLAWTCFRQFRNWREQCQVRLLASEQPLVSERHQYGGTFDWIAMFGNMGGALGLIDCKSSSSGKPYPDMWLALAAHGKLWLENYPNKPLDAGHHLLLLPKNGSTFRHIAKIDLTLEWELFRRQLELYKLEKEGLAYLGTPAHAGAEVPVSEKAKASKAAPRPRAAKAKASPRQVEHRPMMTMGELLRGYGHVPEYA